MVVRRLPPTMTEEELLKQIEPIPDHDYFYFVPADWSLGVNATCRAYINFCNQNDIFIFRDKFDGYVFVDKRGSEYPAIVEFAPFQGLPKSKSRKKDHKANTIESEPHFLAFEESLKDEETEGKSELKMEYSFQLKDGECCFGFFFQFSILNNLRKQIYEIISSLQTKRLRPLRYWNIWQMYGKRDAMSASEKLKIKNGNVKKKNNARKVIWLNRCQKLSMKMLRFD